MPRRRSGIVGTAAKTAVIAGTATAASGAVQRRMHGGNQPPTQAPAAAPPEQVAAPAQAAGMTQDQIDQLKQLAQLKEQGVLTDAEFQAQKQKILGS